MASGILGTADLAATTDTTVYTVPANTNTSCNVSMCNRTSGTIDVRLALAASGTPSNSEYIEFDFSLTPNSVLERTGLSLDAAKLIVARASATGVSVVITGVEE